MDNLQLYVAVGPPVIAVLTGLTVSLVQIWSIRCEMRSLCGDMQTLRPDETASRDEIRLENKMKWDETLAEFRGFRSEVLADLRQFYHLAGKMEGRIDALEKK